MSGIALRARVTLEIDGAVYVLGDVLELPPEQRVRADGLVRYGLVEAVEEAPAAAPARRRKTAARGGQ